jgi:site-specific recombinase XerD
MNNKKINIIFLLAKARINKQGKCPLRCRITYNQKRREFATGLLIKPNEWDNSKQCINTETINDSQIETQLSLINHMISQAFLFLQVQQTDFDVNDIYLHFKGENIKSEKTLLEIFDLHNDSMQRLINIEYSIGTYKKFLEAKNHTQDFIKHSYKKQDLLLKEINLKFLTELDRFLKIQKKQKQITINKTIQRIRKIIKLALSEGFIITDPFLLYKPKKVKLEVIYLTPEELSLVENYNFKQRRLEQIKDLFIFCCYTGLPYEEMVSLKNKNIISGFDKAKWISIFRKKTKKYISIPLLGKAEEIITKYTVNPTPNSNILPKISNQKFNSYLKEIAEIVGIEKRITHHTARKTFATTILLYNDIPIEIVSELLGHAKISTTQEHYAKVVQKKVSEQMKSLSEKLSKTEEIRKE